MGDKNNDNDYDSDDRITDLIVYINMNMKP